jgi:mannose-6-phosphate isomerase-like protein (cupin superfamily)
MTRLYKQENAKLLSLPGRKSLEVVSSANGPESLTLRLVEIPVPTDQDLPRAPHLHAACDECIYVLSGLGTTHADSGDYALQAGDAIVISAGESHVTRNTGAQPLVLLCFFPLGNIDAGVRETAPGSTTERNP